MKHLALAVLLTIVLATPTVFAQQAPSAPWYLSSLTARSMGAMDVHGARREGTMVTVTSGMYLAKPEQTKDGQVDFIVTADQYDCATPGRNRILKAAGYQANVRDAVFFYELGNEAQWKQAGAESAGMSSWETACKGPQEGTALQGMQAHEDVLARYRSQLSSH